MHILLVEDDTIIASGLTYALRSEGWDVTHCADTAAALAALKTQAFTFALLDLSLPDGDGYVILEAIRRISDIPVVFVTAADDEGNTVKALELGADDYITKPFRLRELLARIKTVRRRTSDAGTGVAATQAAARTDGIGPAGTGPAGADYTGANYTGADHTGTGTAGANYTGTGGTDGGNAPLFGGFSIDTATARVTRNGADISLTAMEYRLLLVFAQNRGQTMSRRQILESLWDAAGNFVNDNTLTVYIKRLREKLGDDPQDPKIIQTVRGLGYRAD